jgi:hypothetical protein
MRPSLLPLLLLLVLTLPACRTGVDKDAPEPEPAVGRTFEDGTYQGDTVRDPQPGPSDTL